MSRRSGASLVVGAPKVIGFVPITASRPPNTAIEGGALVMAKARQPAAIAFST